MNVIKTDHFGEVEMIQLGYGPIGPPMMSVFLYIVDGLVIDTGQHHMARAVLGLLKDRHLKLIALSHHHEDHSGNAALISNLHKIPVIGHPLTAEKLRFGFSIRPYQHMVWGRARPVAVASLPETVETDRFTFTPVYTPGHSKDHTVFLEKKHGWLFSGDLYIGERIKFFRSDERFSDQIASLKKVLELDFETLFCGHNPSLSNGKVKIRKKLQFLEELYGQIHKLVEKGFSAKAVIRALDPKSDRRIKWITLGNASFANMVRSAMASMVNADRSRNKFRHGG
jgi:glyoxylase-like metal-dependent hydrolase (beta-lactamase superfamily II)